MADQALNVSSRLTEHTREVIADHPVVYNLSTFYGIAAMFRSDTEELDRVLALGVDTAAHRAVARTASLQL